jgi:hypothetical protein
MAMPQPGDLITAFSVQPGRCFRMVYSRQLQATHCDEPAPWRGWWKDAKGQTHRVSACGGHAGALEGSAIAGGPLRSRAPQRVEGRPWLSL